MPGFKFHKSNLENLGFKELSENISLFASCIGKKIEDIGALYFAPEEDASDDKITSINLAINKLKNYRCSEFQTTVYDLTLFLDNKKITFSITDRVLSMMLFVGENVSLLQNYNKNLEYFKSSKQDKQFKIPVEYYLLSAKQNPDLSNNFINEMLGKKIVKAEILKIKPFESKTNKDKYYSHLGEALATRYSEMFTGYCGVRFTFEEGMIRTIAVNGLSKANFSSHINILAESDVDYSRVIEIIDVKNK